MVHPDIYHTINGVASCHRQNKTATATNTSLPRPTMTHTIQYLQLSYSREDVLHSPGHDTPHYPRARSRHGVCFAGTCLTIAEQTHLTKNDRLLDQICGETQTAENGVIYPYTLIDSARVGRP